MSRCIVSNCPTLADRGVPLFRFPSEPWKKTEWLEALGLSDEDISKTSSVCLLHFSSKHLNDTGSRILLRSFAVPRIKPYDSDESNQEDETNVEQESESRPTDTNTETASNLPAVHIKEEPLDDADSYVQFAIEDDQPSSSNTADAGITSAISAIQVDVKQEDTGEHDGVSGAIGVCVKEEQGDGSSAAIGVAKTEDVVGDDEYGNSSNAPQGPIRTAAPTGGQIILLPNGRKIILPRSAISVGTTNRQQIGISAAGIRLAPRGGFGNVPTFRVSTGAPIVLPGIRTTLRPLITQSGVGITVSPINRAFRPAIVGASTPRQPGFSTMISQGHRLLAPATAKNQGSLSPPPILRRMPVTQKTAAATAAVDSSGQLRKLAPKIIASAKNQSDVGTDPLNVWPWADDDGKSGTGCTGNLGDMDDLAFASFQRHFPTPCCARCEVMSAARMRFDPPKVFSLYTGVELGVFEALCWDVRDAWDFLKSISKDDTEDDRRERTKNRVDPEGRQWFRPDSSDDELLMTLMKLKTNFPASTIAYLFGYETDVAIDVLQSWIPFLANRLQPFILRPATRADFARHIPDLVRRELGDKAIAILDVVEVKVAFDDYTEETASAKFVVVYNWRGAVVYRSRLFDGAKTSDRAAIKACGRDLGLAADDVNSFLKNTDLYLVGRQSCVDSKHCYEPEKSKYRSCELVAQLISKLRQFAILTDGDFPIGLIPCLDEIVTVCCALVNLTPLAEIKKTETKGGKK